MPLVKLGDAELNYQVLGAGQDVVLIHGLGANLAFWYWIARRLSAAERRVVLYDLRGHGHSSMTPTGYTLAAMCEDLRRLLDHLGIERAHLVGHSFGARLALAFAGVHAGRTRTLTVADAQVSALQGAVRLREWRYWKRWKRRLQRAGLGQLPDDDAVIDFNLLTQVGEHGTLPAPAGRRRGRNRLSMMTRDMGLKGGRRWQELLETTKAKSELEDQSPLTKEFFGSVAAPTLLLYGRYSHCLETSEALLRLIPDCERILIPGAGHFHPAVKPKVFTRLVTRFLDRHERAGQPEHVPALQ